MHAVHPLPPRQPPPPSTSLSLFPCQSIATNINKDKTEKPKAQCRFSIRYETGKVQARRKVNFCRFMVTITVTSQTGNRGYVYSICVLLLSSFVSQLGPPPPPNPTPSPFYAPPSPFLTPVDLSVYGMLPLNPLIFVGLIYPLITVSFDSSISLSVCQ